MKTFYRILLLASLTVTAACDHQDDRVATRVGALGADADETASEAPPVDDEADAAAPSEPVAIIETPEELEAAIAQALLESPAFRAAMAAKGTLPDAPGVVLEAKVPPPDDSYCSSDRPTAVAPPPSKRPGAIDLMPARFEAVPGTEPRLTPPNDQATPEQLEALIGVSTVWSPAADEAP